MLLKNLMEDKQLNFDQPLLSVRRHGPSLTSQKRDNRRIDSYSHQVRHRLPTHVSELKSGPIRDPGAVPFLWEQSPGQPKEEAKPQIRNFDKPPIAPKLPPGRYRKAKQQDYRNVSQDTTGMNQAVNVPCISENKKQEVNVSCNSRTGPSNDESVRNIESSKDIAEKESSDSEDSDEAYVDALDTLSRAESSFLNCSMSGLSGLEDLDVKPSRSFSKDPQAREFMMDRFIPAAKAMASETPHAPKKQPVQLQIEQPKKTANECKPSLRYGPSFAKRYAYYNEKEEEEEEEESDDEYDQQANLSSVCGLLPRFCLKSSVCLINPVPAMSVRTRVPTSSANKVRPRSSSSGSYSEMENESRSDKTETKSIDQMQTDELDEDKAKLSSKNGHTTSTNRDATLPFLEHKEVLLVPEENMPVRIEVSGLQNRGLKTFQEFLDDRGSPNESNSGEHVVEKTLYVDTVQKVKSPNLRPFSPNTQETEGVPKMLEEEDALKSRRTERMHATDSPHEDLKKFHTADRDEKLLPNARRFGDCNILPSIAMSAENRGMENPQAFGEYQDSNRDSTNKDNLVANVQEAMESLEKQLPRAVTSDNSQQNHFGLPAPPPLPKSPSDSWLWRTLPSMTTKNPSLRPYLGAATNPESHCFKAPASDMKWETIVKTTKVQRRHMHYSEESLTTIPEA